MYAIRSYYDVGVILETQGARLGKVEIIHIRIKGDEVRYARVEL